jgi:LmbE family N-acetylglucosaminyl deacetylase
MQRIAKGKMRVVAIAPHPDDLEIGCGGTLAKLARAGHEIHLVLMTGGEAGGHAGLRRREQEAAAKVYKAKSLSWLGFADTQVPVDRASIDSLDKVLKSVKPDLVFANHSDDTHQDHRATASIVLSATRYTHNVLFYEVPTSVNFSPDVFVDITGPALEAKFRALKAHKSQVHQLRVGKLSIIDVARSMAHFRGYQGRVESAEGFKALRLLLKA